MKKKTKEYSKETYRRALVAALEDLAWWFHLAEHSGESWSSQYCKKFIEHEMATRLKEADTIYE